jgi:hypothetical protein
MASSIEDPFSVSALCCCTVVAAFLAEPKKAPACPKDHKNQMASPPKSSGDNKNSHLQKMNTNQLTISL